jgi:hypothetical protein
MGSHHHGENPPLRCESAAGVALPVGSGALLGDAGAVVAVVGAWLRCDECGADGRIVRLTLGLVGALLAVFDALPPTGVLGVMRNDVLAWLSVPVRSRCVA